MRRGFREAGFRRYFVIIQLLLINGEFDEHF